MTKEVEVGDEFTGKVVKTTTFGAFVELAKGTDGLLHISNITPGERAETVEDVVNRGDELDVQGGRGRQRARPHRPAPRRRPGRSRASPPRSCVGRHRRQGPRGGGDRGDRGGRGGAAARRRRPRRTATAADRGGDRRPPATTARSEPIGVDEHTAHRARLGRPGRDRGDALGALDRARLLDPGRARATRATSRRASRTSSSTCCSRARTASARSRSTRPSTPWGRR